MILRIFYKFRLFIWTDWSRGSELHKNQSTQRIRITYSCLQTMIVGYLLCVTVPSYIVLYRAGPDHLLLAILFEMSCAWVTGLAWMHPTPTISPTLKAFTSEPTSVAFPILSCLNNQGKNIYPVDSPPIWWSELLSFTKEKINMLIGVHELQ